MKRRRVKITGIGPVTPAGVGREEFWNGILEPVSRVRPFTKLDPELGEFVAAYVDRFKIEDYFDKDLAPKGIARHTQFAAAGALLALRDAGISLAELKRSASMVVSGSSLMDFEGIGRTIEGVTSKGVRGAVPRTVYTTNAACIPATVADMLQIDAKTMSIQTSCCAGMDAIGHAARMVATGEADIAICGGTEAPLYQTPLVELRATGLTPSTVEMPKRINRPFDLWRTTGVVSEGCCMLVIEPESSPRPGYAYISGYAYAGDAMGKLCAGMAQSITHALADAGLKPKQVDAIQAWGPGHRLVDAAEAEVLYEVFGAALKDIPAVSIKGAIGNPLGAAPAIMVAATALALRHATLPPTVNWEFPDPACALNLSAKPRLLEHSATLINAHGLAGLNAALVLEKC